MVNKINATEPQSLQVDEPKQEFEWSAPYKLVNFDVTVPQDTPEETLVVKFDVHVEGVRVAKLRLDLHISRGEARYDLSREPPQ